MNSSGILLIPEVAKSPRCAEGQSPSAHPPEGKQPRAGKYFKFFCVLSAFEGKAIKIFEEIYF
jgi:hypothetical protein